MGVVNGLYFINQKPKAKCRKNKVTIFLQIESAKTRNRMILIKYFSNESLIKEI